ncbi:hypothetical protein [Methylobacterium aerolatum]|uniref:XRE family transcriptional regulator n=1 Tax=Methylobacterium aerolatum TaxID=418708 RepID=A0ABU0I5C2_9HYPH|nr:hypothetical protein [Methylobacterium aerolatum]MDQ0449824.1 hypothetical protein [Methylobacterium aerolatum]GJD36593.1 hypothetical protein FMGBMHLM_3516 [Methylobacterium aerolatum]
MTRLPDRYNPVLDVVASALGVPVEHFFEDAAVLPDESAVALLRAWAAISDAQAQRRVLSFAQHEADKAAGHEGVSDPTTVVPLRSGGP